MMNVMNKFGWQTRERDRKHFVQLTSILSQHAFEVCSLNHLKLSEPPPNLSEISKITQDMKRCSSRTFLVRCPASGSECRTVTSKHSSSCFDLVVTEDKRGFKVLEGHSAGYFWLVCYRLDIFIEVKPFGVFLYLGHSDDVK